MEAVKNTLLPLLDELSGALDVWRACVEVDHGVMFDPLTGEEVDSSGGLAELLTNAVCSVDVPPHSLNGSVDRYPGIFSVSPKLIVATHELNAAKERLESVTRGLDIKWRELRSLYAMAGWARVHPLQAWRRVNILDAADLHSVGFTVAKKEMATELLSLEEICQRLSDRDAFDLMEQVQMTGGTVFGWHEPVSPHIRANVVWGKGNTRRGQRFYASLPFLVAAPGWPSKRVRFNQPRDHAVRSDLKHTSMLPMPFRQGGFISVAANQKLRA